jgi:von Willebrand factor type A domain
MTPKQIVQFEREKRIIAAKEKRFTITARILSGKQVNVKVVDDPRGNPAQVNLGNLELTLNEASPRTNDKAKALVFDRAKMFHEIDHVEFTRELKHRETLYNKSKNGKAFLDLSNILEDGRIERLGREKWQGTGDYLDAILLELAKTIGRDKISGLVLYVRTKLFRNEGECKYWQPFVDKINEAVACPNSAKGERRLLDIAFEITEAIAKQEQEPSQGNGNGKGKDKGNSESQEQGKTDSESSEDKSALGGEQKTDSEGQDSEEEGNEQGEGIKSGQQEGEISEETMSKINDIVDQAINNVRDEVKDELEAILQEAEQSSDGGVQQLADGNEQGASEELANVFTSLLVEQNRVKYSETKQGILNTLALPSALTNRKCFQVREETLGAPFVALLLDVSGSMGCRAHDLSVAARILNASLQKAKVNTRIITFGSSATEIKTIAADRDLRCPGMSTQTGMAMKLANDWLEEQGATRALMIVVTDGAPDCLTTCEQEKARCEALNGYVLGVRVGFPEASKVRLGVADMQWNEYLNVLDVSTLPHVLQPCLETFIAGTM